MPRRELIRSATRPREVVIHLRAFIVHPVGEAADYGIRRIVEFRRLAVVKLGLLRGTIGQRGLVRFLAEVNPAQLHFSGGLVWLGIDQQIGRLGLIDQRAHIQIRGREDRVGFAFGICGGARCARRERDDRPEFLQRLDFRGRTRRRVTCGRRRHDERARLADPIAHRVGRLPLERGHGRLQSEPRHIRRAQALEVAARSHPLGARGIEQRHDGDHDDHQEKERHHESDSLLGARHPETGGRAVHREFSRRTSVVWMRKPGSRRAMAGSAFAEACTSERKSPASRTVSLRTSSRTFLPITSR